MKHASALNGWFEKIDADTHFLVRCFAEVLEEQGRHDLAACLPWLPEEGAASERPDVDAELQVQAIAFHLLNLVEENAAAQARREREAQHGVLHEPGLWGHGLRGLTGTGGDARAARKALEDARVDVVLTAHPTEAKRPDVLRQHRELYGHLALLENSVWTPRERDAIRERVKVSLERLWRTGEVFLEKPGVLDELDYVMDYLTQVFPTVVLDVRHRCRAAWEAAGLGAASADAAHGLPRLCFSTWVGGDRDGHPLVTADVTREALGRLRSAALQLVDDALSRLSRRLTLSRLHQAPPASLATAIDAVRCELPQASRRRVDEHFREPWRQYAEAIRCRWEATRSGADRHYPDPAALANDLAFLYQSLAEVGAARIAEAEVTPVLVHLDTFGFHLAALDIRQNSAFYERALSQLLAQGGFADHDYADWDFPRRRAFLETELASPRPMLPRGTVPQGEAGAVLACFQAVADHVETHGAAGIGSFIVSMTRDVSDLLAVYVFAREVGLVRSGPDGLRASIQVVPLFETVDDLRRSPAILRNFLQTPLVRRSLCKAPTGQPEQQVMLGYSDSTKDGGIVASHWGLHRAQRELAGTGRDAGVSVTFFHGRGGTFSRGAGPTHRFLEALPPGTMRGTFRMTEQGEVIAQKFANHPTAMFNLELLLTGVTVTTHAHRGEHRADPRLEDAVDQLSRYSEAAYRDLLEYEGFLEFWAQATPIDALEQSFIGSRPVRRTGRRSLEDLRAIPWVFSWTQARYYLTGWYGVGSGLEQLRREDPEAFERLADHLEDFPFMRYLLYNVETSLLSADPDTMRAYAQLVEDPAIRTRVVDRVLAEYERTGRMTEAILGKPAEERRPRLLKTLRMRADGLGRLHARQIELLRRWRGLVREQRATEAEHTLPTLLLSINAIAGAERTTG